MACIKPAGVTLKALDAARLLDMLQRYRPLSGLTTTGATQ